jgi:hypothetical protein
MFGFRVGQARNRALFWIPNRNGMTGRSNDG